MINSEHPTLNREYSLYRYRKALERGDFETVAAILSQAEHDPLLDQMILELATEVETPHQTETKSSDWKNKPSSNGQPLKFDLIQEKKNMTTQTAYWEPSQSADRANRWALAMALLVAALVISILFLFLIPSGSSKQTLVVQQPTLTPAEIAKLYVDELWGKGNQDLAKTLLATDFVDNDPMFVNNSRVLRKKDRNNSAVFTYNIEVLRTAFPDLTVKTEAVVEGSNQIVVRWTFTGTHTQPFLNFAATNKSVTMTNTDILSIKDGQIVERWGANNLQAIMDATEIITVTPATAEAVTAFARYAYIFSAGNVDDLGAAFTDEVMFNGKPYAIKDFEATIAITYKDLGGITNIRMISGNLIGNHLTLQVEFDTNGGKTQNKGRVEINMKDGKIASYDFFGGSAS